MPLDQREWENSVPGTTWTSMTLDFLEEEHPLAYSVNELIDEFFDIDKVNIGDDDDILNAIFVTYIQGILEQLIERGEVESKINMEDGERRETYFRAVKDESQ